MCCSCISTSVSTLTDYAPAGAAAGCPGSAAFQSSFKGFARASLGQPTLHLLYPSTAWPFVGAPYALPPGMVIHPSSGRLDHPFRSQRICSTHRSRHCCHIGAPTDYVFSGCQRSAYQLVSCIVSAGWSGSWSIFQLLKVCGQALLQVKDAAEGSFVLMPQFHVLSSKFTRKAF